MTPHPGDPAIVFGERGTVVSVKAVGHGAPPTGDWPAIVSIDVDDGLRWNVATDRLLWDGQRWNVLPVDPPEPKWLHEDPLYVSVPLENKGAA
jgi:hypothetical protein